MKERPILFSAPMILAIAEGRKTETRRTSKRWQKVCVGDRLWVKRSRFQKKADTEIWLEVTGKREERLQEITALGVLREGLKFEKVMDSDPPPEFTAQELAPDQPWIKRLFTDPFSELWNSINGKKPGMDWDSNPEVTVIEFRRIL